MKCKIVFADDTRRVTIEPCSYVRLQSIIHEVFFLPGPFVVKYCDDEGEFISVSSDQELDEAFSVSKSLNQGILKLHVSLPGAIASIAPALSREASTASVSSFSSTSTIQVVEPVVQPSSAVADPTFDSLSVVLKLPPPLEDLLQEDAPQEDQTVPALEVKRNDSLEVLEVKNDESLEVLQVQTDQMPDQTPSSVPQASPSYSCSSSSSQEAAEAAEAIEAAQFAHLVHSSVRCDGCDQFPLQGLRYKCFVCKDYDLCHPCHVQHPHAFEHLFAVIKEVKVATPPEPTKAVATQMVVTHHNIVCDGCQMNPITGVRFKCSICPNYDLCESCEVKGVHETSHPFLKLKQPLNRPHHAPGNHRWGGNYGGGHHGVGHRGGHHSGHHGHSHGGWGARGPHHGPHAWGMPPPPFAHPMHGWPFAHPMHGWGVPPPPPPPGFMHSLGAMFGLNPEAIAAIAAADAAAAATPGATPSPGDKVRLSCDMPSQQHHGRMDLKIQKCVAKMAERAERDAAKLSRLQERLGNKAGATSAVASIDTSASTAAVASVDVTPTVCPEPPAAPASAPAPVHQEASLAAEPAAAPASVPAPVHQEASPAAVSAPEPVYQEGIAVIQGMGFNDAQAQFALQATQGNVEAAIELLLAQM